MYKKVNIAHLIPSLGLGGAEKYVFSLFQHRSRDLFNSKIIHWQDCRDTLQEFTDYGDEIIKLNFGSILSVTTCFKLIRLLKNLQIDILHTHLMDADLIGFFACRILRIPQLITIHSYPYPIERRHCNRYRFMSLFNTSFVFVSNKVKNYVLSKTGISERRTFVVHTGIDLEKFHIEKSHQNREHLLENLSIDKECKIVGNVSRLVDGKGHRHLLLAAVDILKNFPNTVFLIIGDGVQRVELVKFSHDLNISDHVRFAGSRTDIPELLDLMDIFVFPAYDEAFGISALEAMAMGKAIIATNDAAVPEIIENNKESILIEPQNPKLLSKCIQYLLSNPDERVRLGNAAWKRSRHFSIESMVREIERIYLKILLKDNVCSLSI